MVELSQIRYQVVAVDEKGVRYDITDEVQNLGWEENEKEISVRSSFTVRNDKTLKGYLSAILKPGCFVGIIASDGNSLDEEVARGYIETWNPVEANGGDTLKCTCYDELYKLQKSQDSRYYPSGTGTKSAIQGLFSDWGIRQGAYRGPNVSHGKLVYNNQYLSDILLDLLDQAAKKGSGRYLIRAERGSVSVLPRGSNGVVYVFRADNTESISQSVSTADLITRVKVIGKSNGKGQQSVEVTLNGKTEFGIRQRVYTRGTDESLEDAKAAAQEILEKEGKIEKSMVVQSPDVPSIRKGDLVYVIGSLLEGYYFVRSIQHNADSASMSMDLEAAKKQAEGKQRTEDYQVGDVVQFRGGTHYISSYPGSKGYAARAGKAKITKKDGAGKAHPWHLIHVDNKSNVYGWVDDGTFD